MSLSKQHKEALISIESERPEFGSDGRYVGFVEGGTTDPSAPQWMMLPILKDSEIKLIGLFSKLREDMIAGAGIPVEYFDEDNSSINLFGAIAAENRRLLWITLFCHAWKFGTASGPFQSNLSHPLLNPIHPFHPVNNPEAD